VKSFASVTITLVPIGVVISPGLVLCIRTTPNGKTMKKRVVFEIGISVGPGQVLADMIASGAIPVVRLSSQSRQP
jgi:hypothetical protein